MAYVEWLRVKNAIKIVLYILAGMFVVALIGRVAFERNLSYEAIVHHVQMDPGTKTSQATLPDGTQRIVFDDPDGTHVTIDDRGYQGKRITIVEPASHPKQHESVAAGSIHVTASDQGKTRTTVIETDGTVPFAIFLAIGCFFALIVATMLGAPLARENDGHLEYAFTKPVSRESLAAAMFAVDAAGIVGTVFITAAAFLLMMSLFQVPHLTFQQVLPIGLNALIVPLAWYAMLAACTSSMRRGYGAILGFSWPVLLTVGGIAAANLGDSSLGHLIVGTFRALSYLSPLHYASFNLGMDMDDGHAVRTVTTFADSLWPAVLVLAYSAVAVVQWRRVQA